MRYTKKQVEAKFETLCCALGHRQANAYNDVGGWMLDYAACYGGYNVVEISNERGGQSQPFGMRRMNAAEFVRCVDFLLDGLRVTKYK